MRREEKVVKSHIEVPQLRHLLWFIKQRQRFLDAIHLSVAETGALLKLKVGSKTLK
jgi:hypothetical protein